MNELFMSRVPVIEECKQLNKVPSYVANYVYIRTINFSLCFSIFYSSIVSV